MESQENTDVSGDSTLRKRAATLGEEIKREYERIKKEARERGLPCSGRVFLNAFQPGGQSREKLQRYLLWHWAIGSTPPESADRRGREENLELLNQFEATRDALRQMPPVSEEWFNPPPR